MGSRRKRRRSDRGSRGGGAGGGTGRGAGGGREATRGGLLGGLRGGFKGIVGQGAPRRRESLLSRWLSYALLAAAVALLIYRLNR
ncbi:MAG: hypothetical protein IPL40_12150 [Proteobacteria bacterium]|nr:hypothetical protein [Pseudomonadota bacterium]